MKTRRNSVARILLLTVAALVSASMTVPYGTLDLLRSSSGWIDETATLLLSVVPGVDLGHVLAFGAVGVLAKVAYPRVRGSRAAAVLVALACITELLQRWSPGRDPEVSHALLEMLGGMGGFGFAWVVGMAMRPEGTADLREH